jgi:crotonobetainyl-CoA:carnitine CoA-transferase CaiB-like acyl-CoA transferase
LPLEHLLVLDLTSFRSGPTAVRQLGDWGARVIKIERPVPEATDEATLGLRLGHDFQNLHRNVESITLDLKAPEGREVLLALVARADVLVENYRPGVTKRLGIDWPALHACNPKLVYGSISGFGQTGPWSNRPGYDQVAQGMGGLMSVTGLPGQGPVRAGIAVADSSSGIYLAFGIVTALLQREQTGQGAWVRTSLLEAMIAMMDFQAARWLVEGDLPPQQGNDHPTAVPMGVFPASDEPFNLAPGGNRMFRTVCEVIGDFEMASQPEYADPRSRAARRKEVNERIAARTRTRPAAEWIEEFTAKGVPAGPILDVAGTFDHPQVKHLGVAQQIPHPQLGEVALVGQPLTFVDGEPSEEQPSDQSASPYRGVRRAAPARGEHTDSVLSELGYDAERVAALRAARVV